MAHVLNEGGTSDYLLLAKNFMIVRCLHRKNIDGAYRKSWKGSIMSTPASK